MSTMKLGGIAILIAGVALAASYGARLTPALEQQSILEGAAKFRGAELEAAFEAYCDARAEAELEPVDGCPGAVGAEVPAASDPAEEQAPPTYEQLVASQRARLEALRTSDEVLTGDVLDAREAWLAAFATHIEPSAALAVAETTGPGARLEAWVEQSGAMFGLGLVLIVIGAFVGRRAVKLEATAEEPTSATGTAPKDFGHVLTELEGKLRTLADEARSNEAPPTVEVQRIKNEIEALQIEGFELLVAARQRVQVKYGMAAFAEIFSPLSSAERKLNRAWSALVDHHWPETQESLAGSATDLTEAHRVLEGLKAK